MATTTNYSWTTPDDTALVKDGAAAIRSLGTAIDTTVFNNASAAIAKTIVDAKGDIIAATAADTVSRLAVGANDTVLTADSTTATGLKWAAPAGGGMTLLSTTTLSGTSISIAGISQSYSHLFCTIENATHSTTGVYWNFSIDGLSFRIFRNAVHGNSIIESQTSGSPSLGSDTSSAGIYGYVWIYNYANASRIRHYALNTFYGTSEGNATRWETGTTSSTTAIDEIIVDANGSTMAGGTIRVYGVK